MDKLNFEKVGNYYLFNLIAQTKFSKIYLGISEDSKSKFYAVKKIITQIVSKDFLENSKAEVNLLKDLQHNNIVKFFNEYEENLQLYFILEYCEIGNILEFIKNYAKIFKTFPTQRIIQKIILSITEAVIYLHKNDILHRDLKLKNVVLKYKDFKSVVISYKYKFDFLENFDLQDENQIKKYFQDLKNLGNKFLFEFKESININEFDNFFCDNIEIKIIDLGVSKILKNNELARSIIGNDYSAPEMKNKKGYTFSSDFWNIGAIAFCLMTGKAPSVVKSKIEDVVIDEKFKSSIEIIDFINCLLQKDPKKRLNEKNILQHPFLSKKYSDFTIKNCNFNLNINIKENLCGLWENVELSESKEVMLDSIFIEDQKSELKLKIIQDYYDNLYLISKKNI